ncbi:MAG: methyl-accepting chemotaxis protein [Rhizorhabdus sp.]|nr:methyl-accepting chemotaxis protein [Rhizorhabdus sp.]
MLDDLLIPRKILLSFALLILSFAAASAFSYRSFVAIEHSAAANDASLRVSDHGKAMLTSMIEQQNAVRGYIMAGDATFLETYRTNRDAFETAAAEFKRLTKLPEQRARAEQLEAAAGDWRAKQADVQIALAGNPETRQQAQEMAGRLRLTKVRAAAAEIMRTQDELIARRRTEQAAASARGTRTLMIGAGIGVLIALLLGRLLSRAIATPVTALTGAMRDLAGGNHDIAVPGIGRGDELGEMAGAVLVFRDAAVAKQQAEADKARADIEQSQVMENVAGGLGQLASGDLTASLAGFPPAYARLQSDFNAAIAQLRSTLTPVKQSTDGITTGAGEILNASNDLSTRTEQQAASLEETATAMVQITETVRSTAASAVSANSTVTNAKADAVKSGEVVRQTVAAMRAIEQSSQEISDIISLIDGIAFQTNLLALNAGVEAARAGDAGRGFAVVASEVRALAQRSADAAQSVKERILASSGQVQAGVALVGETGQSLGRIVGHIEDISEVVGSIALAAEEQASGLQQVNITVTEIDSTTQQNAAMVEQSTAAARSLASEAEQLRRQIAAFRLGDAQDLMLMGPREPRLRSVRTRDKLAA